MAWCTTAPGDYRRAVDDSLFGLGEQRYGVLVDLLVQLRQPQLSKRPSEKALSAALTESLPPLDQAVVADVAEAFRTLEEDRSALEAMTEARDAAASFLDHYRRYARIASRRRARLPREAHSNFERISKELGDAERAVSDAETRMTEERRRLTAAESERVRLQARDATLRTSPEMRSARELERVAEDARRSRREYDRLTGERSAAEDTVESQHKRLSAAEVRRTAKDSALGAIRTRATEAAVAARIGGEHAERIDRVVDAVGDPAPLRTPAEQIINRQQRALEHVNGLLRATDDATREVAVVRRALADLDSEAAGLAERRQVATGIVTEAGADLRSEIRGHLDRALELRVADPAAVLAALGLWVETLDGPNPAAVAVAGASQALAAGLATESAEVAARTRFERSRLDELTGEIARLERGEDTVPPVPYTRDPAARVGRPGGPLWRLVEFAEDIDDAERAGVEAALEVAGLLDAWVTPEGELLAADTDDVLFRPGAALPAHLGTILRPVADADDPQLNAVSGELVEVLLSSIGYGEQDVHSWVGADGRFRLGVLTGRWHKATATLIGRTARDAARRVRLAELRESAAGVEAQLAELDSAQQRLGERTAMLTQEVADVPSDAALRHAHTVVLGLVAEQDRLTARQEVAKSKEIAAVDAVAQARSVLEAVATDVGLPTDPESLADIATALGSYRIALVELWPALSAAADAARQMAEAAADLSAAEHAYDGLVDRARVAEQQTMADSERQRTLQETVGAAVAELQRRLTETTELLRANQSDSEAARAAVDGAIEARGVANGQLQTLAGQLELAAERRAEAGESFRRFAGTGLLAVALPELEIPDPGTAWAPIPAMRLARRVNDELGALDDTDAAWDRAQHRLNTELKTLQDTLSRHGNRASADLQEDGVVVEIEFQGRPATVAQLAEALGAEVADRERLLSEREREVLENHLVNEVASTLQELIAAAETQVAAMNGELEHRPTSTGMRLRLLWQPRADGPAGLAAARERLLRQTADAWGPEDRAAVGDFLQARIAEVRAEDTTGTWLEHLTSAMDYRAWNQFVIQRYQNGQWKSATGPASGGERVLAASVPLFAAASSHYSSAGNPYAPRLITLDEAFAGVDDNARAKYLGLLAAFDLDVVMTSEREWGCYPEVPGLAISQLARADGVPAVLVTNWEWDGRRRTRVDRDLRSADEAVDAEAGQAGLWE